MKKIFLLFLLLFPITCFSQSEELEAASRTVQLYFEGMMERDRSKLEEAFFPQARLIGYRGDQLFVTPFEEWASGTSKGTPRDPNLFRNELKSIRIVGNTALAETELYWPGIYYYDFLTLIKMEGKWKIVHKSWFEKKLD
ncbi:nuclear transport factor 2 family protein [Algoriphagus sp. AK58]|uniref:nuclear transport factor 2 family protein n=1 Tax=Algoriphagus sp. AK58 TaxID=1406877 RepID=UPI0016509699|nr:nuclear transport factor 2 family protein [Algoriphagus sp. AK58]MBC6366318.1 dehydrogenase [Algoriphagus sp. AK58]